MDKRFPIKPLDPRAGLWLLLAANIGMFCEKGTRQGMLLSGIFLLLLPLYGQFSAAGKGLLLLTLFQASLKFLFPLCPGWINMVFPVLINYTLRMMPCILAGLLLLRTSSMQKMIAAMRALHLPQGFIIALSTTLRYFPAIRQEFLHIRAAMKLQNIPAAARLECTVVPLMMSAVNTSEEIAAAAVARGIENPCKKTSAVRIQMTAADWAVMLFVTAAVITLIMTGQTL